MDEHRLILSSSRCGNVSTCWRGACSCGAWTKGPHFMPETVQAYWHDHTLAVAIDASAAANIADIREPLAEEEAPRG